MCIVLQCRHDSVSAERDSIVCTPLYTRTYILTDSKLGQLVASHLAAPHLLPHAQPPSDLPNMQVVPVEAPGQQNDRANAEGDVDRLELVQTAGRLVGKGWGKGGC